VDEKPPDPRVPVSQEEVGRPLTRAQIEAIVGSVGRTSPVDVAIDWLARNGPFFLAALFLYRPRSGPPLTRLESILGVGCLGWGLALRVGPRRHRL
jgi:hypothetical protein